MTDATIAEFLGESLAPPRRRWRKWGLIALGLVGLAALAYALFGGRVAPKYATAAVKRGDLAVTVSATGNLAPTNQVNVGSEESGIVVNVFVQNNDHVKKGQPLAQLDPTLFRAALMQNEAQLLSARASVAQNQATLDQSSVTLRRYQEVARLSGGKVPSQTELDTALGDHARAVANLKAAKAQVAQAEATLSTSRTNLAKATIYAPVDGVVLSRQVEPGQTVAAAFNVATLFTIAEDLTAMKLDVKVDEADIGEVAVGNSATFAVDAYPGRAFAGAVTRIDLGANATPTVNSAGTTTSSTSTVVAYTAVLAVRNPQLLLRPGMTATAAILAKLERNQLLVPNAALRFTPESGMESGGVQIGPKPGSGGFGVAGQNKTATIGRGSHQTVYVLAADGALRPIEVTIGSTNGALTAVSGPGLRPGMQIVTGLLAATAT
ncbi:efflux RND transporter periplasmic adaptor subunit [Novosphingobium sp. FSW06-99]|uniref:efflux RND transporter periplasmic adaptor subunit n=1 Tax=Novosphingobium sp. FSW06-99 TaxID=1739113 RepID=UPI00076C6288|nr:efflux RND transporter periplasmic adaptor subunit [Novosphingobium sp. FSW06-99]KUR79549.1 secretion protein HlyD [Novosphingobium sp. FSW06-99]